MRPDSRRTILAVYSPEEGRPEAAYLAVRRITRGTVKLYGPGDPSHKSSSNRSNEAVEGEKWMRLDGEWLIVIQAPESEVEPIVKQLQGIGSPAVFVLRDEPAGNAVGGPEPDLPNIIDEPLGDAARAVAARRGGSYNSQPLLLERLRQNEIALGEARRGLVAAARLGHSLTAAAEWLLDNAYLIRTQIAEIRRHFPKSNSKILPTLAHGYDLAQELVARTGNAPSESNITEWLREYQVAAPLSIAELWLFPLLLRMALIDALRHLAERTSRAQQLREAGYFWANRLAAGARQSPEDFESILRRMETEAIANEPHFAVSLVEQLQDEESALAPLQHWLEEHFHQPITELIRTEHTREAAQGISTANAFGSLRALPRIDFTQVFEAVSLVEAELRTDPVYLASDFTTRDQCRRVVERIGRHSSLSELEIARQAVQMAARESDPKNAHATYFLLSDGVRALEADAKASIPARIRFLRALRRRAPLAYLGGIAGLTASFLALTLVVALDAGVSHAGMLAALSVLALFPLSELSIQIVNALVISLLPPDPLPKMDFENGIPDEHATLVVVPMMLASTKVIQQEIEKLEVRFLANREHQFQFALLADFQDCDVPVAPGDDELMQTALNGIAALNARYTGAPFLLFHRDRVWSPSEGVWIGRERKRGKIEDLNQLLCEGHSDKIAVVGNLTKRVRYVITLDTDTQLPPGTARRMVETISHPLNQAEIDPETRVRKRGYTIIQPRVSIALPGATATRFTRIFADTSGTDPYCQTVSDAQQDLFGEGIFHGKAIYDVQAFRAALDDRFPAETLLSHDLIEGAHAGVGLASDIELFENLPVDYVTFAKRQHRWIRGDWQIAPWIFGYPPGTLTQSPTGYVKNPLSPMNRWRIFDNLRRSLVPVASFLLLLSGWLISAAPGVWSLVVGLAVAIPALAPLLDRLARRIQGSVQGWHGAADELIRALVMIAFLPHQAWVAVDAIVRVAYRRAFSRRHLLEWQPAESTVRHADLKHSRTFRQMVAIAGVAVVLMMVLFAEGAFAPSAVFLALWCASPLFLIWLSRAVEQTFLRPIDHADTLFLRRLSRRTWRYFDDLVNAESNWLPPDNSQVALRIEVAQRTSPTNIGLWLSSALAAADFGYLTPDDFLGRCTATMATLNRMERYEGHLLNWYDTKTLQPLPPRYVSTVDSGNLLASLWVLERGCHDQIHAPLIGTACLRGLSDTLAVIREVCGADPSISVAVHALRRVLRGSVEGHLLAGRLNAALVPVQQLQSTAKWRETGDERAYWISRLAGEVSAWIEIVHRYLPWMETLTHPPDSLLRSLGPDAVKLRGRALAVAPSLFRLAHDSPSPIDGLLAFRDRLELEPQVAAWLDQLAAEYGTAQSAARETVARMQQLSDSAESLAKGINMRFLYDAGRHLFAVGYAVGGPLEFTSHYDLLASEARLASLVAIAKGDVPVEHWLALGRPLVSTAQGQVLLSWSGTMFEFLMPLLFTRTFTNSLLDHACREAVRLQMDYGREKDVPWGISESAYSALDIHQIYQYRAFGVPSLALKSGLEDDLVVAPYASMLALMVDPPEAIANLRRLGEADLDGPMGFYESIDYSRENERDGQRGAVIYAYMAHHQGMSLLAMNDVLHRHAMQRRFHGDVRIRAVETLLFERLPVTRVLPESQEENVPARVADNQEQADRTWTEVTAVPRVHLHGNGRYALMITNSGAGYSRWNEFDVTRWRSDSTCDAWGSYIFIRDRFSGALWSTSFQPVGGRNGTSSASFTADRAEFRRRVNGIETVMEVTIATEDDVELRRVTVTNRTTRARQLEFTSYIELALAPHRADAAHPAFAKIFVETECVSEGVLLARRRPRAPDDPQIWVAHLLVGATGSIQFETDRAQFIGRAGTIANPEALRRDLMGGAGTVLDPIFSLRCGAELEPRDRLVLNFVTLAAPSRDALLTLVAKYQRQESADRGFEMAWTRAQLEFRYLNAGPAAAHRFNELASHLLYPNWRLRPPSDRLLRNRLGQPALWSLGISGDLPILLVTVADVRHIPLVRELLLAHAYWRLRGFRADLVVLNQEAASYDLPLHQQLLRLVEAHSAETGIDKPGGTFLRNANTMTEESRNLLMAAASVVLHGGRGSLQLQLAAAGENPVAPPFIPAGGAHETPSQPLPFLELPYFNGLGGFTADGREYAIYLKPGGKTPTPWVNVMANSKFGALVSESGLGFTWRGNSQSNRLTPWHNDPVSDPQSEAIFLRDDESGAIWTPTPSPVRENDAYRARHGQGYTVFEHNSHAIKQEVTVFVPVSENGEGDPIKILLLKLVNDSGGPRRLTVTYSAEWVLGSVREDQQLHVRTTHDEACGAVFAQQHWSQVYAGHVAFAAASPRATSWSGDRTSFLGRNGSIARPAALDRTRLDNRTGAGADPAAVLQVPVVMQAGQEFEIVFLLGQAETTEAARELVTRYQNHDEIRAALESTRRWWDSKLGALQVRTPLLSIDFMLNRWLVYQALSCRYWGRSGLHQSSGAFGYRDQLQDCLAFLYSAPELTRAHILTCAARQFPEGDVQHWWHAETGLGVRTRCSDDMLWLPFAVAHYVTVTGDIAILDVQIPFLDGAPLADNEDERVFVATASMVTASVWEHCKRAIDHAGKLGLHGMPLMGAGDWNDGMNRVGIEGRGESVWLGWFLCAILESFARLTQLRDDPNEGESLAAVWRDRATRLARSIEQYGWDGDWYLRAFFDDGSPLGSHVNAEARIDSLSQTWAVISGAADPERARRAMDSARRLLVDERNRIALLFTPPFDHSEPHPGYIMGYPPGVRENGGQYTHGSLWLAMAFARMGDGDAAVQTLTLMNPVENSRDLKAVERYRGEPYVVAADVSSAAGKMGQCGWTWYTGSAGWMYRIWIEEVLGFQLRGDRLTIAPVIPDDWPGFEITYRHRSAVYEISVQRHGTSMDGAKVVELDGREAGEGSIPLADDGGVHKVMVWIPCRRTASPQKAVGPETAALNINSPALAG
jgi:cyclic beta-1,2-glucan synthetase